MAKTRENRFEQVKRFEADLSQCMKCGFCTFWCPVYQEEMVESCVARGKNMMIRGLLAGELEYTDEFADRLNRCTLCMSCTTNCPAKANIPNIIVAARADTVRAKGLKFPYNIIYRWLIATPDTLWQGGSLCLLVPGHFSAQDRGHNQASVLVFVGSGQG